MKNSRKHCWRASLRDELPSKRCVTAQRYCLVATASKSTGYTAAMAVIVLDCSGEGGGGQDKKLATAFFRPSRYNICTLNSEMKAKWRFCHGKMGVETHEKAITNSWWSVHN